MEDMISVLIPTRGRADKLHSLVKNIFHSSCTPDKIQVCFYVDDDDGNTLTEVKILSANFNVSCKEGPKVVFSDMWNQLLDIAEGDILMICGDDVKFKTQKWDYFIREEFNKLPPDKIGYVCVNDEIHRGALGVHGFVHKNWVKVLGHITPSIFTYCWADNWVDDIAKMLNRRVYLDEVVVSHEHWINHKSSFDTTYRENLERYDRVKKETEQLYIDTLPERKKEVELLLQFIEENR